MIKSIYIKNFAIIEELHVNFEDGFNVFTGETGAGKSIIVGALSFIKGNRADLSYIRSGSKEAIIKAIFTMNDYLAQTLSDNGYEVCDELTVERKMSITGNNSIKINGLNATLSFLSTLFNDEIDIHSQKQAQYLLKTQNHLTLLDKYLNEPELLDTVKNEYQTYLNLKIKLQDYLSHNDSSEDIDYYNFQVNEIEEAHLDKQEEDELIELEKKIKSAGTLLQALHSANEYYNQSNGIKEQLYDAIQTIDLPIDDVAKIHEQMNDKYYELEDLFGQLNDVASQLDFNEDDINRIEERLFIINKLKRKYKKEIPDILIYCDELKERINQFNHQAEYLKSYEENIEKAYAKYLKDAQMLSSKRQKAAQLLSKEVIDEVSALELNYFDFKVEFNVREANSLGIDDCEFFISTNRGEELKPLTKVASGGEMSRIMLGLKTVFSRLMGVSLVIFDEIDTGVSGKAASAIGFKMAKIASYTQVLSITHLAQVASFADAHYFVSKDEHDGRTTSHISLLDYDQRVDELALMSLSKVNEDTRKVAVELLESSNLKKCGLCKSN